LKKQHKPIGFGDGYDPRSDEGHRNAVNEARETREYNKRMKEIEAEREANKPLTAKLADWLRSKFRRLDRQL
jgi:hypothetical protein